MFPTPTQWLSPSTTATPSGRDEKAAVPFLQEGKPTKKIWYYEVLPKGRERFAKTTPLTADDFGEFFKLFDRRVESARSWTVSVDEIRERNYDLKAVNPHRKVTVDLRTPDELVAEIELHNVNLKKAVTEMRRALRPPRRRGGGH